MERFADPTLFESLTFGEKVAASLVTTLMGMGTTFVILILLWGVSPLSPALSEKVSREKVSLNRQHPWGHRRNYDC